MKEVTVQMLQCDEPTKIGNVYPKGEVTPSLFRFNRKLPGLGGELGYPVREPGQSDDVFMRRVTTIDLQRVSHEIVEMSISDATGLVTGKIRVLATPNGKILEDLMEKDEVCFRPRVLCRQRKGEDGTTILSDIQFITFDAVNKATAA